MSKESWWPQDWQEAYELSCRLRELAEDGTIQDSLHREYVKEWFVLSAIVIVSVLAFLLFLFNWLELRLYTEHLVLILVLGASLVEVVAVWLGDFSNWPNGEIRRRLSEELQVPLIQEQVKELENEFPEIRIGYVFCRSWLSTDVRLVLKRAML